MADSRSRPPSLSVVIDGTPMAPDEAQAFWQRFSEYMESHKGDLGGFAASEGFASVRPSMGPAGAVLLVSRSAPQSPYVSVARGEDGGSANPSATPKNAPAQSRRSTGGSPPRSNHPGGRSAQTPRDEGPRGPTGPRTPGTGRRRDRGR